MAKLSLLLQGSSSTSVVTESLTPAKGMIFEDEDAALEFYKAYAHVAGSPFVLDSGRLGMGCCNGGGTIVPDVGGRMKKVRTRWMLQ